MNQGAQHFGGRNTLTNNLLVDLEQKFSDDRFWNIYSSFVSQQQYSTNEYLVFCNNLHIFKQINTDLKKEDIITEYDINKFKLLPYGIQPKISYNNNDNNSNNITNKNIDNNMEIHRKE